jgi:dienelactone hydrolase
VRARERRSSWWSIPAPYHSFDNPNLSEGLRVFGHWLKYDADATQRSVAEMHDFLAAQFAK